MATKRVLFCAGGSVGDSNLQQKNFSVSTIQIKSKDNRKSLKMRFRMFIRDYTNMFKKGHTPELDKTFRQDLMAILSEAVNEVQENGGTLNSVLGLSMLIPGARKINNQLTLLIRKIGKFFKKNGYISPMLQKKFYNLFPELIKTINEKVGNGEVNEEELSKDEEITDDQNEKVSASASRLMMYAAEDAIEQMMQNVDLDKYPVEEVNANSVLFASATLPEAFKGIKFNGMTLRHKTFNSEMVNITYVMPRLADHNYPELFEKSVRILKLMGVLDSNVDVNNLDFSAVDLDDSMVKFTISVNHRYLHFDPSDADKGVYKGNDLPKGWTMLKGEKDPYAYLYELIDGGLSTATCFKIESYLNPKTAAEKQEIKSALIAKYGNNPIANLL